MTFWFRKEKAPVLIQTVAVQFFGLERIPTFPFFKGIVSRDFGGLQMILMDGAWVPEVFAEGFVFVFSFSNSFSKSKVLSGLSFY